MNGFEDIDYIVVGQGLAGSAVAMNLLKRGRRIVVIDQPDENRASRVAAGLFNPVTGQNSVRTWMASELFDRVHEFYPEVEKITRAEFFFPYHIFRPFSSIAEQNDWMGRSTDHSYLPFIEIISSGPVYDGQVKSPFGGMFLRRGGFVRTPVYLDAVRHHLEQRNAFRNEFFDASSLAVDSDFVTYREWRAKKIIFCQGDRTTTNPFFEKLPVRPLKGETLTIKSSWEEHVILNRGVYMVPETREGEFRVGATYKFNVRTPGVSEEGKRELADKISALISLPFEVIGSDWGIRPTTNDRRPLIGCHPNMERLVIFNGLGTKGVSLAPYFSEVLIHWIENTGPLHPDVALTRFK